MPSLTIPLLDGTSVPWLAFGSGTALWQQDAAEQVSNAITAGFRHIDTAQMYANESSVGEGIVKSGVPRSELYITTKLDKLPAGQTVKDALKDSLQKLRTDYVDLFLIHMPLDHPDLKGTWKQMEELKAEGLSKTIGVSNFQPKHLDIILDGASIEYNPYLYKATQPLLEYMKKHNIAAMSYGGLGPVTALPNGPAEHIFEKVATRLSEETGVQVTKAQVLQIWLRKKGVICVTTSRKKERLQEYVRVSQVPDITDEEEREIDQEGSKAHHRVWATWIDEGL
ncbi:hypothetical protein PHLCEN_2v9167 [Hermanssonia centrifuga]|uniref:NADP-dependent oxidoreductase domain-containing protein n=1 Tax=Hermanssonia centrifuga TaxID=98765 RepID=A0A2R6NRN0_9APHY|nr:hypothetical protein PHLCEN_2v9167 [Hermanssonia centrifuga]